MDLTMVDVAGTRVMEGQPGKSFMRTVADATQVIDACATNRVSAALLFADNLTGRFFDVASGEAGAILEQLRNYGLRLAVVCPPDSAQFSSNFGEAMTEQHEGRHFGVFETREEARAWLSRF